MSPLAPLGVSAVAYAADESGGLNRYTGEVVAALIRRSSETVVYTTSSVLAGRYPGQSRPVRPHSLSRSDFQGNALRLLWHQSALPRRLRQDGVKIFYSPVPEGMIVPVCPQVITVHDLLPLRFPEIYPRLRYYFRHVLPRIVQASAAVIAVSDATRDDVRRFFGALETPIHVVHGAYDSVAFSPATASPQAAETAKRKYSLDGYVLAVGEMRPYKNVRRLIEAFARLPESEVELALVGATNKMDPDLRDFPRRLGVAERVRFLGRVSDRDLAALYGGAAAFVFPSLYEGFGIPPLEAMACGCPVVCSRVASLPEVCGDAAWYVEPLEVDSIAGGIHRVTSDAAVRRSLREKGRERVRAFSYDKAAAEISSILEGVASSRGAEMGRRTSAKAGPMVVGPER